MSYVRCANCGEETFAFDGWAAIDHCAHCGGTLERRRFAGREKPPERAEPDGRPAQRSAKVEITAS